TSDPWLIEELVSLYRYHRPEILLAPDALCCLNTARSLCPIAIVTDGRLSSQTLKIAALGLRQYAEPIVITSQWGPNHSKPNPRAFQFAQEQLGVPPERLLYVGDNPVKDFTAPRQLGWHVARIRRPLGIYSHLPNTVCQPDLECETLN